ncbi:MAG: tetratricopeptide repeat protein [Candidatus Omnitrophica bacterium]|nr:tetratricopeptide repeat protein [Candidatus Omnitrophota bacterium]
MNKNIIPKINKYATSALSIILVLFVIVQATSGIFDTDIWLHLRTGKEIIKDMRVSGSDPYSFTLSGKRWINHEWLFQVAVYLMYKYFDISGLIFLQTLFVALAFLVLFLIGFKDNQHMITTVLLSILVIFATYTRFNLRPDILSLLFFSIFLHQLKFNKGTNVIYILIFWQFLWVNSHGYFFLGPLLILIFIIAEVFRRFLPFLPAQWSQTGKLEDRSFHRLIKLLFLVLLVCFINPHGFIGVVYPFLILKDIVLGQAHYAFKSVAELVSAFPLKGNAFVGSTQFNILVLISLFSLLFNWRKLDISHILLFAFFLPFGLVVQRNITFLSFAAYLIVISRLNEIDHSVKSKVRINVFSSKLDIAIKGLIICVLIVFMAKISYGSMFRRYYDFKDYEMKSHLSDLIGYRYPKACIDFMRDNNLPANLFNDFNSGAYLIFHAYPEYKVFIDGRTELYSSEFFDNYLKIMAGDKEIFDTQVEKFNINTALLNNSTSFIPKKAFKMFYEHPEWQLVFFDESGVVFLRKTTANAKLIRSLSVDLKNWQASPVDMLRLTLGVVVPDPYILRARLLDAVGLDKAVISEAEEALKIYPSSREAHYYLGKAFLNQGKFDDALRHLRLAYTYGLRKSYLRLLLAKTYLKLGEKEKALKISRLAQKITPDDKEIKEFVANLEQSLEEN